MSNKDYSDSAIYTISNYIMWFFFSSLIFLIFNLPALLMLFMVPDLKSLGILLPVIMLTVGPSGTALLYFMGKLFREGDISLKSFFKGYKLSFLQSLSAWAIELLIISVLYMDSLIIGKGGYSFILLPVFYGLIFIVVFVNIHAYPIISRFSMKLIDIYKLSFLYSIKKIHITIGNIVLILVLGFITAKYPSILLFFSPAVTAYLIMVNERGILKEIEEIFKNKSGN